MWHAENGVPILGLVAQLVILRRRRVRSKMKQGHDELSHLVLLGRIAQHAVGLLSKRQSGSDLTPARLISDQQILGQRSWRNEPGPLTSSLQLSNTSWS